MDHKNQKLPALILKLAEAKNCRKTDVAKAVANLLKGQTIKGYTPAKFGRFLRKIKDKSPATQGLYARKVVETLSYAKDLGYPVQVQAYKTLLKPAENNPKRKWRLSKEEIRRLSTGTTKTKIEAAVISAFLFSCYTGLRFSDLQGLDAGEIKEGVLYRKTSKRGVPVEIPLNFDFPLPPSGRVFADLPNSNYSANRTLKKLARRAGLDREVPGLGKVWEIITFHVARATFINSLWKVSKDMILNMKISGHKSPAVHASYRVIGNDQVRDVMNGFTL